MGDILRTVREKLIATAAVTNLVSAADILVENQPSTRADKQIILHEVLGKSEPTLIAEHGILNLTVFVKDSVQNTYASTRAIVIEILNALNKKNENLTDSYSTVRFFIKDEADYIYNDEEKYWMAAIVFSYVEGE